MSRRGPLLTLAFLVHAGCSNPKCWTHDASEVMGDCGFPKFADWGPSGKGREEYLKEAREASEKNQGPCSRGDANACGIVAESEDFAGGPLDLVEAKYTVACRGKVTLTPNHQRRPCLRAGQIAASRKAAGRDAAIANFTAGCALGDGESCASLIPLDPAAAAKHATAACELRYYEGCLQAARIYADPKDPAHDPERARKHLVIACNNRVTGSCEMLGQLEAGKP